MKIFLEVKDGNIIWGLKTNMNFWDINSLSIDELNELSFLVKCKGLTHEQAVQELSKKYPGKIKNLGSFKNGEFESHEITEDGVKSLTGDEGIVNMIEKVIKGKKNATDNNS